MALVRLQSCETDVDGAGVEVAGDPGRVDVEIADRDVGVELYRPLDEVAT